MVSLSLGGSDIGGNCEEKVTIRKPRRPWLKPLLIIVSVVIILHFLTLLILVRVIDLPKATTSLPHLESAPSLGKGPSVGFDLTPSYGTAVARHHNGSVTNVGRVAVDPDYEDMMHRLSTGGRVFRDPYASYCTPEGLADGYSWSSLKKSIRQSLGLPSTEDVGRLAKVIRNLREATESQLGHSITGVVVAAPNFPAMCNDDVEEAVRYIGLSPLNPYGHPHQPHQIATAYARHGFGLCKNNTSIEACIAEEDGLPYQQTLAVSHTDTAFIATLWMMKTAVVPQGISEGQYVADYELGSHSHLKRDFNLYWDRVQLNIEELILKDCAGEPIDKVLLLGESGTDPVLIKVLHDAISLHQNGIPEVYGDDPLYDAARGAAEFANRAQEDQVFPKSERPGNTPGFEL